MNVKRHAISVVAAVFWYFTLGGLLLIVALDAKAIHADTDVVWATKAGNQVVQPRTWTKIQWDTVPVNTLHDASVDSLGVWVFPAGIYSLMVETAWPNVHGMAPHRRKARIMQSTPGGEWAFSVGSHETNSAVTCGCPDDNAPQTFLVEMQPGVTVGSKLWVEVWHNADQPLTLTPFGLEAPSFMLYRLGDL
jgi:hypothetical protein